MDNAGMEHSTRGNTQLFPFLSRATCGDKGMFPVEHDLGAETLVCSQCQHPWQWGQGPATPSATASGHVYVPGWGG